MNDSLFAVFTIALALLIVGGALLLLRRALRRVSAGHALVVSRIGSRGGRVRAIRDAGTVVPLLNVVEEIELGPKTVEITRHKEEGLVFADGYLTDFRARLTVRIADDEASICRVAQSLGCAGAGDPDNLRRVFGPKLSHAVKDVASVTDCQKAKRLAASPTDIIELIGQDLSGFEILALDLEIGRDVELHEQGPFR